MSSEITDDDLYQIFLKSNQEYEHQKDHFIDDGDYPDYIIFAMRKVYEMTKNGEINSLK